MKNSSLDETTEANVKKWLSGPYDHETKEEIRRLQKEDVEELQNAFYKNLDFGTGGLRGIMGVGTNRLNIYTVRSATQGLANYIQRLTDEGSVVIGYDCRHNSRLFAKEAAKVLAANNIRVHLFKELRPVPLVSFGVRHKKCTAGIMITASHNPPQYNGYKVYWSDGCQVLPPHDQGIISEVNQVTEVRGEELSSPFIEEIDGEIEEAYLKTIHSLQLHPGDNHSKGEELSVVYTSLHGAGITMVPKALASWGFSNVTLVEAQEKPDGNFPTIKSPNPEEQAALQMGIETLQKVKGDLLIATDPDTDRIGVVCMHRDKPQLLNGNEVACLLAEYICRSLKEGHLVPPKPMFVKTIVTSELFKAIAEKNGISCLDVLTGFKYIGEKMTEWEVDGKHHYLFGGEESYGYLFGTHARDKDAIISATLIAEMTLQMKRQGKSLIDLLYEIYHTYGVYRERLHSLSFEGKAGAEQMACIMQNLRNTPPKEIGGVAVETIEDYQSHTAIHLTSNRKETLTLPKSNVLRLWLADGTKIVVRPSGTEPKIKLYCAVYDPHHTHIEKSIADCDSRLQKLLLAMQELSQL
ncbi:MAG: Phosphoglucomutase [Chlamydiales bacterium]|nr:Phosphoglucomutase [Chlamydiales bacterium]MCH9619952.1 Phosphoglucomutase [Chlamydiales bacterium]MCH9622621.1 Phosphoglucomutase [Chlamydiales bacterium]